MDRRRITAAPVGAVLIGSFLGATSAFDPPLSWFAGLVALIGAAIVRSGRAIPGGVLTRGTVGAAVVRPLPSSRGRGPVQSERIRYSAQGIDGEWREHEVVHPLASSHPQPLGAERVVSYHPSAPADGRIVDRRTRLLGWWFVLLGLWPLVLTRSSAPLVSQVWGVLSAGACLSFVVVHAPHPPAPTPGRRWEPPPPSWPEADDRSAGRGLVPGIRKHLHRANVVGASTAFVVSLVVVAAAEAR